MNRKFSVIKIILFIVKINFFFFFLSLCRIIPKTAKSIPSKVALLSWLETDFLDSFFAYHQCHETDEDCGLSTGCILVGSIVMRHFYPSNCFHSKCASLNNTNFRLYDFGDIYERRVLKGYHRSYYFENEWFLMTDQIFYSYDEIQTFVDKINSSSSAASLEFLLFNPSLSIFTSVSLLFEMTSIGSVIISSDILPVTISDSNDLSSYLKLFFNLLLLIYVTFNCKNLVWKMMKYKWEYWKQPWNYFSCLFILTYFVYLSFFVLHVIASEKVAFKLQATQLNSNINITEVALLESITHVFIGILMFLHALRLFKILSFSVRLKKMLKRLKHSQKRISVAIVFFFIIVLSSVVMTKCFVGSSTSFSHPLFGFVKVATALFSYCRIPEIREDVSTFGQFSSVIVSLVLIIVHLYLFVIIRSILLNWGPVDNCLSNKNANFSEIRTVIRKRFQTYFKPKITQTVSQIEYVPPIDFLLYELERLADALLTKANSLFPDTSDLENFTESEYDFEKVKLESGLDLLTNAIDVCNLKFDEHDSSSLDRLISTIPRRSKAKFDTFMPSSFHASLGSEKKYKPVEAPTTLLQNRIRKTYPLAHLDSDSSASSCSQSHTDEKVDSVSSLLFRKTKSRGKGKIGSFDLDIEAFDDAS